jgi:hypothetical protein
LGLVGVLLPAGWVAWALQGAGNTFLTVMVIATMVLGGGTSVLVRRVSGRKPTAKSDE